MIIIECHRTNCWNGLAGFYQIETVEKCCQEAVAGDKFRPGYIEVPQEALDKGVHVMHQVTDAQRATFALNYADADGLDKGERDLFAHLNGRTESWVSCCSDKAALRAASSQGLIGKFMSLESLIQQTGVKPNPKLKIQYSEKWLSQIRADFLLG